MHNGILHFYIAYSYGLKNLTISERSRSIDGNNDMFAMMKLDTVITIPRISAVSS